MHLEVEPELYQEGWSLQVGHPAYAKPAFGGKVVAPRSCTSFLWTGRKLSLDIHTTRQACLKQCLRHAVLFQGFHCFAEVWVWQRQTEEQPAYSGRRVSSSMRPATSSVRDVTSSRTFFNHRIIVDRASICQRTTSCIFMQWVCADMSDHQYLQNCHANYG